jgi:S-adenosylmethionine hydrolase
MKLVALITDFGTADGFTGVVKAAIKTIDPDVDFIDICHEVKPFSVVNAQFFLYSSYRYFPAGTVFYVVVDPGVGTERKILVAEDDKYKYVVPDNGIISAVRSDSLRVYAVEAEKYRAASFTFHGRDIFAPLAAALSRGVPPDELGPTAAGVVAKRFPDHVLTKSQVEGGVVHVDRFGNVTTSIPNGFVPDRDGGNISVEIRDLQLKAIACRTYGSLKPGQVGAIRGSADLIELATPQASLAQRFSVGIGDRVRILYNE